MLNFDRQSYFVHYMIHLHAFATFDIRSRKSMQEILPWKQCYMSADLADYCFSKLKECTFTRWTCNFSYSSDKDNICLKDATFFLIFTIGLRLVLIVSLFLSKRKMIKLHPQFFTSICCWDQYSNFFPSFVDRKIAADQQNFVWEVQMIWSDATRSDGFGQV